MKIGIIGATGRTGSRILSEAKKSWSRNNSNNTQR